MTATLIGTTVQLVRGALASITPAPDLVVIDARPHSHPLVGGGILPTTLYELHWPNGGTTWHLLHEFEPIPTGKD